MQKNSSSRGRGVIGLVFPSRNVFNNFQIDSNFLEPNHNKQEFVDSPKHSALVDAVNRYLTDYWTSCGIDAFSGGAVCFICFLISRAFSSPQLMKLQGNQGLVG